MFDLGQVQGHPYESVFKNYCLLCDTPLRDVYGRHREDDESYWLNIADVCARFAVAISKK